MNTTDFLMDVSESSVLMAFVESGEELDRVGKDWTIDRQSVFSLITPQDQDIQINDLIDLDHVRIAQDFYKSLNEIGWNASSSEFKDSFTQKLASYQAKGGKLKLSRDRSTVNPDIENRNGEEQNLMAGLPSSSSESEKYWLVRLVKLISR